MNERWRVALAGLVAALAIPFLIVDSPAPAEGVVTSVEETPEYVLALEPAPDPVDTAVESAVQLPPGAVEIIVTTAEVSPDISRLADQAGTWGLARAQAIVDGRVDATFTPPPSNTDYSLLPVVNTTPVPTESEGTGAAEEPELDEPPADEIISDDPPTQEPEGESPEGQNPEDVSPGDSESPGLQPEADGEPDDVQPGLDPQITEGPAAPAQVDGRVPPPPGGPTAAQWNALRKCESTHNYGAISPSGLYRGAYQFSQQTWNWVAGIHWPHLVGIDPVDAAPAWQDVMAYTLYAMRGWDQWPICGKNLL